MQCRIKRQKKIGMSVTTSTTSLLELSNGKPTESIFLFHTSIFEIVYHLNLDLTFLNSSFSFKQNSNQKIIGLNQTLKQKYVFNWLCSTLLTKWGHVTDNQIYSWWLNTSCQIEWTWLNGLVFIMFCHVPC
jgi:hypothetical protein